LKENGYIYLIEEYFWINIMNYTKFETFFEYFETEG